MNIEIAIVIFAHQRNTKTHNRVWESGGLSKRSIRVSEMDVTGSGCVGGGGSILYLQNMAAACSGGIALRLPGHRQPGSDIRSRKYSSSISGVLNVLLLCLQNSLKISYNPISLNASLLFSFQLTSRDEFSTACRWKRCASLCPLCLCDGSPGQLGCPCDSRRIAPDRKWPE